MWITRVSINNPVFACMVMVALCVLGLFSYAKLGVEQMPDISFPGAWLEVRYPGASPEAVEREVIKPIEEAVNSVAGVKRITSRSGEGMGTMSVEFGLDTDMGKAMQEVRDRVASVQSSFPRDVKQPTVARWNNDNAQPVVNLALVSKTRSPRELSYLGEYIVGKRLQRVEGVARVEINGLTQREVRIDLDPVRLRAYQVTPAEISAALAAANADQPVGLVSDKTQDALLRVEGRVRDPRQFENVVVARRGDLALTLADLGQLVEREKEPESYARINGQRAINFNVFKQQDANIVKVGEADIFAGEAQQAAGDVARVFAARQHPREPIQRGIAVGAAQRFVQRADEVVVAFLRFVVQRAAALHEFRQRRRVERRVHALRQQFFGHDQKIASVAVRHRFQRGAGFVGEGEFAFHQRFGAGQQLFERRVVQTVQNQNLTARQQRAVQLERWIFGCRADQHDGAVFDIGQQHVLLRPVEAVDFVDEQQRALACRGAVGGGFENLAQVGYARRHRRHRLEREAYGIRQQPRDGRFAASRRPPQDQRGQTLGRHHATDGRGGGHQMVLAYYFGDALRP